MLEQNFHQTLEPLPLLINIAPHLRRHLNLNQKLTQESAEIKQNAPVHNFTEFIFKCSNNL